MKDIIPPLSRLTKKCLDLHLYGFGESFCNLLVAVDSGRWDNLPDEEQAFWLERLANLIHTRGLGETIDWADPDYRLVQQMVEGYRTAMRRKAGREQNRK